MLAMREGDPMIGRFLGTLDPDILDRMCKLVVFVTLISAFVRGFFLGKISDEGMSNVVMIVIGFYFGRATPTPPRTNGPTTPPEVKP
jgi:di/tricarboxylate transporter